MIAKLVNSSLGQLEFLVDISVDEVMKELKTQEKTIPDITRSGWYQLFKVLDL